MVEKLLKVTIVLTVFAILALAGWNELRQFLDTYFRRGTVPTPALAGQALTRVLQQSYGDLKIRVDREVFDADHPRGVIVSQDPAPGVLVQKDATVYLRISKGSDVRLVPDVRGTSLRRARLVLQKAQLRVGHVCYVRDRRIERGTVIAQYPEGSAQVGKRSAVDLLLSDGWQEKSLTMPRLLGIPRTQALSILQGLGLTHVNVIERPTSGDLAGLVIEHRPAGGVQIPVDQNVVVTVSAPPGAGEGAKSLEITYQIPPGLTEKLLEITATDLGGRRVIHRKRHMPGDTARVTLTGRGVITVQYFLDKIMVKEEKF